MLSLRPSHVLHVLRHGRAAVAAAGGQQELRQADLHKVLFSYYCLYLLCLLVCYHLVYLFLFDLHKVLLASLAADEREPVAGVVRGTKLEVGGELLLLQREPGGLRDLVRADLTSEGGRTQHHFAAPAQAKVPKRRAMGEVLKSFASFRLGLLQLGLHRPLQELQPLLAWRHLDNCGISC